MIARADPVLGFLRSRRILLASRSARRQELFQSLGLSFELISTSVAEIPEEQESAHDFVRRMARTKVDAAVALSGPDFFTIGADTVIALDHRIVGKPRTREEAQATLLSLRGRSHQVVSGVHAREGQKTCLDFSVATAVHLSHYSEKDIADYIESDLPFDRAGAYGIQDYFGCFHIQRIDGDYNNVLGFPLHMFYQQMLLFIEKNR
ncbi:MAG: septum formation protein Maf [Spirochaetales bacterium]|nr:septum formation protein Maf [Spirochaetales bacterium]